MNFASAIDYGTSLVDKPARALRGLLGGQPRETLAIVPFSDTIGLTDPRQRLSGHDLTTRAGLTTHGGLADAIVGQGAEALLDPTGPLLAGIGAAAGGLGLAKLARTGKLGRFGLDDSGAFKLSFPPFKDIEQAMATTDTPLGRFKSLSDAAGVRFEPGTRFSGNDDATKILGMIFGDKHKTALAGYNATDRYVIPNLAYREWFEPSLMNKYMVKHGIPSSGPPLFSTSSPYHPAIHEIGHALHHANLGADELGEAADRIIGTNPLMYRAVWEDVAPKIRKDVSIYGSTKPTEMVAESFAKKLMEDRPLPSKMGALYEMLKGPGAPPSLLDRLNQFLTEESGSLRIPLHRAPYTPEEIFRLTGRTPTRLTDQKASDIYRDWIKSLDPEETAALKAYSNGTGINRILRGDYSMLDKYLGEDPEPGIPLLSRPKDYREEVFPYLDSALSRTSIPNPSVVYRVSDRFGPISRVSINNGIAKRGDIVSDRAYLSTSISPWEKFYGAHADPGEVLFDILVPPGSKGGYIEPLTHYKGEKEMVLPRDSTFSVRDISDVPIQRIKHSWHRLDPAGKPIPTGMSLENKNLFNISPLEFSQRVGNTDFGNYVVPDEIMSSGWRDYVRDNLSGESTQKNVLLEMLSGGLPPHRSPVYRLPVKDMFDELLNRFREAKNEGIKFPDSFNEDKIKFKMNELLAENELPEASYFGKFDPFFDASDLLRSRPRPASSQSGNLAEKLLSFMSDESGALRIPQPGRVNLRVPKANKLFRDLFKKDPTLYGVEDPAVLRRIQYSRDMASDAIRRNAIEELPVVRAQAIANAFKQPAYIDHYNPNNYIAYVYASPSDDHGSFIIWPSDIPEWFDRNMMREHLQRLLYTDGLPNKGADSIAWHELGHSMHRANAGYQRYTDVNSESVPLSYTFSPPGGGLPEKRDVASMLSWYATTNPREFVAEMFSGMAGGNKYDDFLNDLYEKFGGQPMTPQLRDVIMRIQEQLKSRFG